MKYYETKNRIIIRIHIVTKQLNLKEEIALIIPSFEQDFSKTNQYYHWCKITGIIS